MSKDRKSLLSIIMDFEREVAQHYGMTVKARRLVVSPMFFNFLVQEHEKYHMWTYKPSPPFKVDAKQLQVNTSAGILTIVKDEDEEQKGPIKSVDVREWWSQGNVTWQNMPNYTSSLELVSNAPYEPISKAGSSSPANTVTMSTDNSFIQAPTVPTPPTGEWTTWDKFLKERPSIKESTPASKQDNKGGKQDLLKLRAYIDKLIETEYGEENK
jgi:hypothetical protein